MGAPASELHAHGGLDGGHQQGGGDAFAGHVADGEGHAGFETHEIVIIARHDARGIADAGELQGFQIGDVFGKKLALDFAGDLQFRLEALFSLATTMRRSRFSVMVLKEDPNSAN
jgi:hypothetical protein